MLLAALDLTNVLDTLIITLPAIIAAVYAARVHREIKTPSGKSLGAVAEYAHDTAIANNLLLAKHNGPTTPIDKATIDHATENPARMPAGTDAPKNG